MNRENSKPNTLSLMKQNNIDKYIQENNLEEVCKITNLQGTEKVEVEYLKCGHKKVMRLQSFQRTKYKDCNNKECRHRKNPLKKESNEEKIKKWLKENNFENKYKITCKAKLDNIEIEYLECGHKKVTSFSYLRSGEHRVCSICRNNKIINDFLEENNLKEKIKITCEDKLNNVEIEYLECGHKKVTVFATFRDGSHRECPICKNKIRKLNNYISSNNIKGYKVVKILNSTQVIIEHECCHQYKVYWANFTRGTGRCSECKNNEIEKENN